MIVYYIILYYITYDIGRVACRQSAMYYSVSCSDIVITFSVQLLTALSLSLCLGPAPLHDSYLLAVPIRRQQHNILCIHGKRKSNAAFPTSVSRVIPGNSRVSLASKPARIWFEFLCVVCNQGSYLPAFKRDF